MRLRGKVLRALGTGPGLVIIEGRQYRFTAVEWRSAARPVPGMEVDAVLDDSHQITQIVLASEGLIGRGHAGPGSLARILHRLNLRANRNRVERRS